MSTLRRDQALEGRFDSELAPAVDERTLEILERRRGGSPGRRRGWLVRRMLLVADVVGLCLAFVLAEVIAGPATMKTDEVGPLTEFLLFAGTLPLWIVMAKLYGLYDNDEERADHSTVDEFMAVFHLVTVGAWAIFAVTSLSGLADPYLVKLVLFWAGAVLIVTAARTGARGFCRRQMTYLQNTVIVGAGDVGQLVARKFVQHPEYGINLVGFVDAFPKDLRGEIAHLPVLGPPEELADLTRLLDIERIVVAFSNDSSDQALKVIRSVKDLPVQIDIVPRLFEIVGPRVELHTVEGFPLLGLPPLKLPRSSLAVKRALDLGLGAVGLLLAAPVMAFIALRIKLDSPGPVFYRHERIGRDGKPFRLVKFRTMYREHCRGEEYGGEDAEVAFKQLLGDVSRRSEFEDTYKLHDDPRVTKVGRFLRQTSLDELPQLLNVLRGELSLVGPRPITQDELDRFGWGAESLLNIRPGVTGYWQINGRSETGYQERVRLDLAYVTGWSLGLDLTILVKTFRVLAHRSGAY